MYRLRSSAASAALISTLLLGACASNPPQVEQTELQRSAMQRWKACLSRNINTDRSPTAEVSRLIGKTCEGHKRDVIVLFPPHLASQVDQMLVSSAQRYIGELTTSTAEHDGHAQTIKTLLR